MSDVGAGWGLPGGVAQFATGANSQYVPPVLERAIDLLFAVQSEARLEGEDFQLSSGSHSQTYFDLRRVLQHPKLASAAQAVFYRMAKVFGAEGVGGPESSGILLTQLIVCGLPEHVDWGVLRSLEVEGLRSWRAALRIVLAFVEVRGFAIRFPSWAPRDAGG